MKLYESLLIIFLFSTISFAQENKTEVAPKELEIILGIFKIVKLDFVPSTKIQVENESILNYQLIPSKREITFKGVKPGKTSVIIRNTVGDIKARYQITVTQNNNSKVVQKLKDFLGDIEGLEIGIKGDTVYAGGKIFNPSDIGRIVIILDKFPDVIRLVELSPLTQNIIAKKMQEEIQKAGMKTVSVRVVNGSFWLDGTVDSDGKKSLAEKIAIAYIPDRIESLARRTDSVQKVTKNIIENFINVNKQSSPPPTPKQLKISAQFVELTRDYNKIFGFKWSPILGGTGGSISFGKNNGGLTTATSDDSFAGTISNLFPKLAAAKSAGHARVIQSGVIITKNQVNGKISKKSEKPFQIGNGEFAKPEKAVSGFDLQVTPQILAEEKIDLKVGISVSSTVGDPPETLSNNISTSIVVKSKESAVVGGIVINKTSTDFDRNSPFGTDQVEDGSPLFTFLRSKAYLTNKSQFVVFLTPEIIESASTGVDEIKRKFKKRRR